MLQKPVTRRTLLKALLAGSGAIGAASFLPEKWLKPVVHSGVLPVHAQSSLPGRISGSISVARSGDTVTATTGVTAAPGYKVAKPKAADTAGGTSYTGETNQSGFFSISVPYGSFEVKWNEGDCPSDVSPIVVSVSQPNQTVTFNTCPI